MIQQQPAEHRVHWGLYINHKTTNQGIYIYNDIRQAARNNETKVALYIYTYILYDALWAALGWSWPCVDASYSVHFISITQTHTHTHTKIISRGSARERSWSTQSRALNRAGRTMRSARWWAPKCALSWNPILFYIWIYTRIYIYIFTYFTGKFNAPHRKSCISNIVYVYTRRLKYKGYI